MMKQKLIYFGLVLAILLVGGLIAQDQKKAEDVEKIKIEKAYVYREEELLISEIDLYGSHLLRKEEIPQTTKIIDVEKGADHKEIYDKGDTLILEKRKFQKGDRLLIISSGKKINNRYLQSSGIYYQLKGIAEVTDIETENIKIKIRECYFPVNIGDLVIAFNQEQTLIGKKISYLLARLPEKAPAGQIAFFPFAGKFNKDYSAMNDWAICSLTKKDVKRGDFLLIHRKLKKNLPVMIIGSAIVVHAEDAASTIKILESSLELEAGDQVTLLSGIRAERKEITPLPIIKALESEAEEGVSTSLFTVLFKIDSAILDALAEDTLAAVANQVKDKKNFNIILRAYACSIGQIEYNLALSQKRAESVKNYLSEKFNLDPERIELHFYGENELLNDNSAEETRRLNRAVHIEVLTK